VPARLVTTPCSVPFNGVSAKFFVTDAAFAIVMLDALVLEYVAALAVALYTPGVTAANAYAPVASVVAEAPFESATVAPAIGAPVTMSVTMPSSAPGVCVSVKLYVAVALVGTTMPIAFSVS